MGIMKLYGYFRSSAAFRLRIALNLKGLEAEAEVINLRAGDQSSARYKAVNPQGRVPALDIGGEVLIQSLAIIEYLDETHPEPPLLPADALGRARVRALADLIACDIHPLNNLVVLNYIKRELGADDAAEKRWYRHWVAEGFAAFEALLAGSRATARFCHGDAPGLADICLVPQVFNAQRFDCPLGAYPTLMRIFAECMRLDAFERAQPSKQPEAATIA
jgi:maleylacetoacetate isomerase/maleylpyruvate isomerase